MLETLELRGRIKKRFLQRSLNRALGKLNVKRLRRLSAGEIGQMLHDSAMGMVKSSWGAEAQGRSKLDVLNKECRSRCVDMASKRV